MLALIGACGGADSGSSTPTSVPPPTPPTPISAVAKSYLIELVSIMRANWIRRSEVDWDAFQARVLGAAPYAQGIAATDPAIREALSALADGHSSYLSALGTTIYVPTRTCTSAGLGSPTIPANVGYVRIGPFSGTTAAATTFTDSLQSVIRRADADSLVGWIVDIRGNSGGNMWPMLAGVGPLLGDGPLGYFLLPTSQTPAWEYRDGSALLDGSVIARASQPYTLRHAHPRIAVLTDNGVASSGEAMVLAFRKGPDTRSFGTATCGLSTSNLAFSMSDGAVLNLTTGLMADRTRTGDGGAIAPDEAITDQAALIARAVEWLRSGK